MRTTLHLEAPVLRDLKKLQKREGKSLGRLASELLAEALGRRKGTPPAPEPLVWNTTGGRLLLNIDDKDAVYAILDAEASGPSRE